MTGKFFQSPLVLTTRAVAALEAGSAVRVIKHGSTGRIEPVNGAVTLLGAGHCAGFGHGSGAAEMCRADRGTLGPVRFGLSRRLLSIAVPSIPNGANGQ
ncbi:hypothetical protein ACFYO8_00260 [Micromonospora sp. NPDC005257]|uniref:hypothetical protein n=1 Tax=Micromonospora sp. NPDC005257 TaxID=3364230 RepID=UPI0036A2AE22